MKKKMAPHRHEWQERNTRDWRYVCAICGMKSRNDFCQEPQFQRPYRLISTVLIGPGAGTVSTAIVHPDGSITAEKASDEHGA